MEMKRVYDLPTRVFHWLFAALFIAAFTIGSTVDDDSALFSYHMLAGIILCFLVSWRIVWGLFGTRYARFTGFALKPTELLSYAKGFLTGDKRKWPGHNPASSWAAVIMMIMALGLGLTGYIMTSGQAGKSVEEIHEVLANGFMIIVLLHVAGIAVHTLRYRDGLWKSMYNGEKADVPLHDVPVASHRMIGALLLAITLAVSVYLLRNFNSQTQELALLGTSLNLGEVEHSERGHGAIEGGHAHYRKHDEDDDDDH